jgi:hypothetical protein
VAHGLFALDGCMQERPGEASGGYIIEAKERNEEPAKY